MNNVKNVVLLACGSFNPPTVMHLRLFEIARDSLTRHGYNVLGGVISPVHDGYGKKGLVRSSERCAMVKLALQSSDWVRLSDWESTQEEWSETKKVLYHHQSIINNVLNNRMSSPKKRQRREEHAWLTENIVNSEGPVKVMLLCGGDMLDSFGTPGLWKACDIETIVGDYGLVVISRSDSNPQKTIYESDVLTKFQSRIHIVMEWICNEVNSTKIRRAVRRNESIKYLVPDPVINYINQESLYCTNDVKNTSVDETPSPDDVKMISPAENVNELNKNC